MRTKARFPELAAGEKDGHYESFYLKLVRPGGGKGAWIRHTVHKRPGEEITARCGSSSSTLTPPARERPSGSSGRPPWTFPSTPT